MIQAIRQLLLTDATLAGLVDSERIYSQRRWLDTAPPAIILSRISTNPTIHKGSVSNLDRVRIQVSIYAESPAVADQMGALVRSVLDRYSGTQTVSAVDYVFDLIRFEDESDDYDDSAKINYKRQDYFVSCLRTAYLPDPGIGEMQIGTTFKVA